MSNPDPSCQGFRETSIARRTLLRAGGMGLLGMSMPKFLRASEATAAAAKGAREPGEPLACVSEF